MVMYGIQVTLISIIAYDGGHCVIYDPNSLAHLRGSIAKVSNRVFFINTIILMACPLLCNYDDYFLYLLFQKAQPFLYFCLVCLLSNKLAKLLYLFYQLNPFSFVLIALQLSLNGFLEILGDLLDIASNILDGLFINFPIIGHFYSLSYFVYPYFFFLELSREDSNVLVNDLALIGLSIHLFLDQAYSVDGEIFDLGQLFQQSTL